MSDFGTALIRTIVPVLAGLLIAALATAGVDVDENLSTQINAVVAAVATALYYAAAGALERYVSPRCGWLLGVAKTPTYSGQSAVLHLPATGTVPEEEWS